VGHIESASRILIPWPKETSRHDGLGGNSDWLFILGMIVTDVREFCILCGWSLNNACTERSEGRGLFQERVSVTHCDVKLNSVL
jgi:hypothetical protein